MGMFYQAIDRINANLYQLANLPILGIVKIREVLNELARDGLLKYI